MRIVSGKYRGRRIESPPGNTARPTTDRMRESLFSILQSRGVIQGAVVMDAFAGSGALGLEALSRGADFCVFVEASDKVLGSLKKTVDVFRAHEECILLKRDVTRINDNRGQKASLVFLDPPYHKNLVSPTLLRLENKGWLAEDVTIVIETAEDEDIILPGGFDLVDERRFGNSRIRLVTRDAA